MKNILVSQSIVYDSKTKVFKDQLDNQVINYLIKLNYVPITISNGLKDPKAFIRKTNISGIVLTGGANIGVYLKRDRLEKFLIDYSIKKKIPLLGICRGMQIINHFFNGNLKRISNHVRTRHLIKSKYSKKMYIVNSYHEYCINEKKMNHNIIPIYRHAKDNSIESFIHNKHKILGIMWHPEREKKVRNFDKKIIQKFFKKIEL